MCTVQCKGYQGKEIRIYTGGMTVKFLSNIGQFRKEAFRDISVNFGDSEISVQTLLLTVGPETRLFDFI